MVKVMGIFIKIILATWASVCAILGSITWTFLVGVYFMTGFVDLNMIAGFLLFIVPAGTFAALNEMRFLDIGELN